MQLQQLTISKIDDFCGKEAILRTLKKTLFNCPSCHRDYIENLILYVKALYEIPLPLTRVAKDYEPYWHDTIDTLNYLLEEHHCNILYFLKNLINYNVDYVSSVRFIA